MTHRHFAKARFTLPGLVCLGWAILVQAAPAQRNGDGEIRELLHVLGVKTIGQSLSEQVLGQLKMSLPHVPEQFWQKASGDSGAERLWENLIPLYRKHFEPSDIRALLRFYRSPIGKKLLRVQPRINGESARMGQAWSDGHLRKILERLRLEGYR